MKERQDKSNKKMMVQVIQKNKSIIQIIFL
jgi:hypothetical protein